MSEPIIFTTNGEERFRITPDGDLFIIYPSDRFYKYCDEMNIDVFEYIKLMKQLFPEEYI